MRIDFARQVGRFDVAVRGEKMKSVAPVFERTESLHGPGFVSGGRPVGGSGGIFRIGDCHVVRKGFLGRRKTDQGRPHHIDAHVVQQPRYGLLHIDESFDPRRVQFGLRGDFVDDPQAVSSSRVAAEGNVRLCVHETAGFDQDHVGGQRGSAGESGIHHAHLDSVSAKPGFAQLGQIDRRRKRCSLDFPKHRRFERKPHIGNRIVRCQFVQRPDRRPSLDNPDIGSRSILPERGVAHSGNLAAKGRQNRFGFFQIDRFRDNLDMYLFFPWIEIGGYIRRGLTAGAAGLRFHDSTQVRVDLGRAIAVDSVFFRPVPVFHFQRHRGPGIEIIAGPGPGNRQKNSPKHRRYSNQNDKTREISASHEFSNLHFARVQIPAFHSVNNVGEWLRQARYPPQIIPYDNCSRNDLRPTIAYKITTKATVLSRRFRNWSAILILTKIQCRRGCNGQGNQTILVWRVDTGPESINAPNQTRPDQTRPGWSGYLEGTRDIQNQNCWIDIFSVVSLRTFRYDWQFGILCDKYSKHHERI